MPKERKIDLKSIEEIEETEPQHDPNADPRTEIEDAAEAFEENIQEADLKPIEVEGAASAEKTAVEEEKPAETPTEETQTPVSEPVAPAAPQFDEGLLQYAAHWGIPRHEAHLFGGTPEGLYNAARLIEQREAARQRETQPPADDEKELLNAIDSLSEEASDPDVVKGVKALRTLVERKFNEVRNTIPVVNDLALAEQQRTQEFQEAQNRQTEKEFHAALEELDHSDLFGKGHNTSLKPDSQESQNRMAIVRHMASDTFGYAQAGLPIPSTKTLVERALRAEFPEQYKERLKQSIAAELTGRKRVTQAQAVARPTNRNVVQGGKSRDNAIRIMAEGLADMQSEWKEAESAAM